MIFLKTKNLLLLNLLLILMLVSVLYAGSRTETIELTGQIEINDQIVSISSDNEIIYLYLVTNDFLDSEVFTINENKEYILHGYPNEKGYVIFRIETADRANSFSNRDRSPIMVSISPELIYSVNPRRCISCNICVDNCPVGAITMVRGVAVIDQEKCISCGICKDGNGQDFKGCPVRAINSQERE